MTDLHNYQFAANSVFRKKLLNFLLLTDVSVFQ